MSTVGTVAAPGPGQRGCGEGVGSRLANAEFVATLGDRGEYPVKQSSWSLQPGKSMAEGEDEIVLSELDDDELVQQMHDDLYDGLKEEIEESVG